MMWRSQLIVATSAFVGRSNWKTVHSFSSLRLHHQDERRGSPSSEKEAKDLASSSAEFATTYHAPVMCTEVVQALLDSRHNTEPLTLVDGTLGGGGHSAALLQQLSKGDLVLGCDVDPTALRTASCRLRDFMVNDKDPKDPFFLPIQSNFADLLQALKDTVHPLTKEPITHVDGILLDLGVSSHQIDTADRGFAFMKDGPLDMRLGGKEHSGLTAADICNEFGEQELRNILKTYGDEPRSKQIAQAIVTRRPLRTTADLMETVASVTPEFARKGRRMGRTATLARVFQSLRIVVNQEDVVLQKALTQMAPALLRPGGRLVVLSYHSMEDRATKRVMRDGTVSKRNSDSDERDIYGNYMGPPRPFRSLGKPRKATVGEVELNPRARSATMRVAERLEG